MTHRERFRNCKRTPAAGRQAIDAQLERRMGGMCAPPRFIPGVDHHVGPDVSLAHFSHCLKRAWQWYRRKVGGGPSAQPGRAGCPHADRTGPWPGSR